MIQYCCDYCNTFFDEPHESVYTELLGDFHVKQTDYFCPVCGSDSFSEADYCPKCDEPKLKVDTLCKDCRKDLLTRFKAFADELTEEEEDQLDDWLDGDSIKSRGGWS